MLIHVKARGQNSSNYFDGHQYLCDKGFIDFDALRNKTVKKSIEERINKS